MKIDRDALTAAMRELADAIDKMPAEWYIRQRCSSPLCFDVLRDDGRRGIGCCFCRLESPVYAFQLAAATVDHIIVMNRGRGAGI